MGGYYLLIEEAYIQYSFIKFRYIFRFGLPLLSKQPGLPHNCFISEEAVNWCIQEVDGVKNLTSAIALMQVCLLS